MLRHCLRLDRMQLLLTACALGVYVVMSLSELANNQYGMTSSFAPYLPIFLATVWSAPMLARELETGTAYWSWTQRTTRTRWMLARAGVPLGAAVIASLVLTGLVKLTTVHWTANMRANSMDPDYLVSQGVTLVALCVFAVCWGLACAALLRKLVPAIALSLVGTVGAIAAAQAIAGRIAPTATLRIPANAAVPGRTLSVFGSGQGGELLVRYQPDSYFWQVQGILGAVLLALALCLAAVSVGAVRRTAL
jgi:hypothetical protein